MAKRKYGWRSKLQSVARLAGSGVSAYYRYRQMRGNARRRTGAVRRTKLAGRIAGSRTRTRTVTRRRRSPRGGGGSHAGSSSTFVFGRRGQRFLKGLTRVLGPRYISSVSQSFVYVPVSGQAAHVPDVMNNTVADGNMNHSKYLFSSEDMAWILDGAYVEMRQAGTALGNAFYNARVIVQNARVRYTMKNHTTIDLTVWVYDLVARKDAKEDKSADRDPRKDLDPITTWRTGLEDITIVGNVPNAGAPIGGAHEMPGMTPFKSERFTANWHVRRVKKFELAPGAQHIHTVRWRGPRIFKMADWNDLDMKRKTTYACMLVAKGSMVRDTSTPFRVGYGSGELDVITETMYKYQAAIANRAAYQFYSNLPLAMTAQGTVSEDYNLVTVNDTVV